MKCVRCGNPLDSAEMSTSGCCSNCKKPIPESLQGSAPPVSHCDASVSHCLWTVNRTCRCNCAVCNYARSRNK